MIKYCFDDSNPLALFVRPARARRSERRLTQRRFNMFVKTHTEEFRKEALADDICCDHHRRVCWWRVGRSDRLSPNAKVKFSDVDAPQKRSGKLSLINEFLSA